MGANMDKVRATAKAIGTAGEALWSYTGNDGIFDHIWEERCRQIEKFGDQTHPNGTDAEVWGIAELVAKKACAMAAAYGNLTWADILGEETAEALASEDPADLRAELVQVAAVCAAWIQDLDSKKLG